MCANKIYFYGTRDEYGFLSNFYRSSIVISGVKYPTTEHYFQSKKFEGTSREKTIREAASPMEAAMLGRDKKFKIRKDWESVKEDVMYTALKAKFTQNSYLRAELLKTGTKELIEHTKNDSYWADGGDGSGKNRLGILLMNLRKELSDASNQ
jgi:ribA/ribD-fused uncharacterized protein